MATWPFLRASWRRLGVAFSVLSSRRHQAILIACIAAPTEFTIWSDEPAAEKGERGGDDEQRDADLQREADREHVELRHDPGDHPERDVGDQQREHRRRCELDRADEDLTERARGRADERRDLGRLVSGTNANVRASPRSIQASPPIVMKIISPTSVVQAG